MSLARCFATLGPMLALALSSQLAHGVPAPAPARVVPDRMLDPSLPPTGSVCNGGEIRCHAHVHITSSGAIKAAAAPAGFSPADIQSAYHINPTKQIAATIAIVDAYGYTALESDLATYRAQFGLPPCTRSNNCLKILNQDGQPAPLPGPPPAGFDWGMETALDVAMASAACPSCRIVVVQGNDPSVDSLFTAALTTAILLHPAVVSNSWGGLEAAYNVGNAERWLAQYPGVGIFASTGDSGYQMGGMGPQYPSTSSHVVAVGGTVLSKATNPRGWSEVAWSGAGSSCSNAVPRLATQRSSACAFRVASDLSAVSDPGVAVYYAKEGGWITVGGTSAATPIVATIFAASGNGDVTPDAIAGLASTFNDVKTGTNGTCNSALCKAGVGWDGPTGYGTPNADQLGGGGEVSYEVTSPHEGDTVAPGFAVTIDATDDLTLAVTLDNVPVGAATAPPYRFTTPTTTAPGPHMVQVLVQDQDGNQDITTVHVTVSGASNENPSNPGDVDVTTGGCSSSGGGSLALTMIGLAFAMHRRRR